MHLSTRNTVSENTARELALLSLEKVKFHYNGIYNEILNDVSLTLQQGSSFCIAAPNGTGKTTFLKICAGEVKPTNGTVQIYGQSSSSWKSHKYFGYAPQNLAFPSMLTVRECIRTIAAYRDSSINEWLHLVNRFQLSEILDSQVLHLSGGYQRRVAILLSFIGTPHLLLLDEPLSGVDIESKTVILSALSEFQHNGGSIIWTTHDLRDLDMIEANLIILNRGIIAFNDNPRRLIRDYQQLVIETSYADMISAVPHTLCMNNGNKTIFFVDKYLSLDNAITALKEQQQNLTISTRTMSFDEAYLLYLRLLKKEQ